MLKNRRDLNSLREKCRKENLFKGFLLKRLEDGLYVFLPTVTRPLDDLHSTSKVVSS